MQKGTHPQAVRVGNLLFLSGALARDTDAEFGDIGQQTEAIFQRIKHIVEKEGGTLDNVVKITNFVMDNSPAATRATQSARVKLFGDNLPASTRVRVAALSEPHLLIEIDAIAVLDDQPI
ncbi:MAG: hypothetical protein BZY80_06155 [SAR202 cluster bacterium Io17-Chloro-G2]|nr:MAG: hypothetical protein BZY80_06155 [SAR202 cluster bacterium Io17-Chloro-G2]